MKNKIMIVFGTRPEAIKICPLILELKKDSNFDVLVCSTGQHKEMLYQVLDIFNVKPNYELDLMNKCNSLSTLTSKIITGIDDIIKKENPQMLLIQGDTTTSLASSISGFYNKLKIIHLEAGLRTFNKYSPFPEEINRKIISSYSDFNLAPTSLNEKNLINENISKNTIFITGNTVIDSLFYVCKKIQNNKEFRDSVVKSLSKKINLNNIKKNYIIVTCHRRENHGDGLKKISNALKKISINNPEYSIIFPVHLNPKIKNYVKDYLGSTNNIFLTEPLDYVEFIYLMKECKFLISDSGGIQEEAPSLGKPVLVTRDYTERQEAISAGTVILCGTNETKIFDLANTLINDKDEYERISQIKNPYGNGKSSQFILNILKDKVI